jgi:hypothetical protein
METIHFLQWTIVLVASTAAAWGGARYAISSHEKTLEQHQKDLANLREEVGILTPRQMTERLQDEITKLVPFSFCRDRQAVCLQEKICATNNVTAKLDDLFTKIDELQEKREKGKDESNRSISDLAKQIAILETTIRERTNLFSK